MCAAVGAPFVGAVCTTLQGPDRRPDPQADLPAWLEVDETWLSIGGVKCPVAVVLGPKGE